MGAMARLLVILALAALVAVVVELDADRVRVHVEVGAPVRDARMPRALPLVHELHDGALARHEVMRAHLAQGIGERRQRPLRRVVARVVDHDQVRAPLVEIGRGMPGRGERGSHGRGCARGERGGEQAEDEEARHGDIIVP